MQRLQKLYRANYLGEEITTELRWEGSQWIHSKEFIPNRITNLQQSNRAVIIGNGSSRNYFNIGFLKNHRGGGQGRGALQTYGCNAVYRDYEPTFLIATGKDIVDEIANSGYCDDHIVYAHSQSVQNYPGKFYLPPQDPGLHAGALATYLACFDGHEKIYYMGFDNSAGDNFNNNVYADTNGYEPTNSHYSDAMWIRTQTYIMELYNDVEFIRVQPTSGYVCPPEWLGLLNFRQITYQDFVVEVDL